ncbi:hypothetical protein Tsubulata_008839 [Turnera subulata]|uniref:F-box domain-containing protein n=1 Tax=Turnera subulata TaxID=218843 RepID=A0A9Q0FAT5_9ROSI|nr:hypothetical protein Tsubulata_008839 [Turnera subulata]
MNPDGDVGVDRLTDLPDHILAYILSFLQTKQAARTSVLSSKWKKLWTVVPVLRLHSNDFYRLADCKKSIRHVLQARDTSVQVTTFHFVLRGCIDNSSGDGPSNMQRSMGTLKTLQLYNFELPDEPFASTTITSLWLESKLKVVNISGSGLLELHVDRKWEVSLSRQCKVHISAPNVRVFGCFWDPSKFSMINFPWLQHLLISTDDSPILAQQYKNSFLTLLQGLSTAQFITMSLNMVMVCLQALVNAIFPSSLWL